MHARPIDLVVFQEPMQQLLRETSSRRGLRASSRSAVRTGRLRRSPAVHSRPIDLVVFQEPSQLMLPETSSWRGLRA